MEFNFSKSLVEQVKSSYLRTLNPMEFEGCKTDTDLCLTFFRVSNELNLETGLASRIADVVVEYYSRTLNTRK
jgi:hypothetical protein